MRIFHHTRNTLTFLCRRCFHKDIPFEIIMLKHQTCWSIKARTTRNCEQFATFEVFLNEVCHAGTVPQVHLHTVNWDCTGVSRYMIHDWVKYLSGKHNFCVYIHHSHKKVLICAVPCWHSWHTAFRINFYAGTVGTQRLEFTFIVISHNWHSQKFHELSIPNVITHLYFCCLVCAAKSDLNMNFEQPWICEFHTRYIWLQSLVTSVYTFRDQTTLHTDYLCRTLCVLIRFHSWMSIQMAPFLFTRSLTI